MKLLDTIKKMLRKRGIILKPPLSRKKPFAKPGACKFIESYDLEVDQQQRAEDQAKANELPHPIEDEE